MRIHIDGQYWISGTRLDYSLEEVVTVQKGKNAGEETTRSLGNYATVQGALKGLLKVKIADSKATSLEELAREVAAYNKMIESKVTY